MNAILMQAKNVDKGCKHIYCILHGSICPTFHLKLFLLFFGILSPFHRFADSFFGMVLAKLSTYDSSHVSHQPFFNAIQYKSIVQFEQFIYNESDQ